MADLPSWTIRPERSDDSTETDAIVLEGMPTHCCPRGFEWSVPHGMTIDLPSWAPPEAAQVRRPSNYDPSVRGRVIYPPAFDDLTNDLAGDRPPASPR